MTSGLSQETCGYMSNFEIIIPWRDIGCDFRRRHFNFLYKYYSKFANVIVSDSSFKNFNRAEARNNGVRESKSKNIAIIDADNFIKIDQILNAVCLSQESEKVIRPFNSIHYLSEQATERFYQSPEQFIPKFDDYVYMYPSMIGYKNSGGAFVLKKTTWELIGGMDEKFEEWGLEDSAFNFMSEAIVGPSIFIDGPNYNLYHPAERILLQKNIDRYTIWYKSGRILKERENT